MVNLTNDWQTLRPQPVANALMAFEVISTAMTPFFRLSFVSVLFQISFVFQKKMSSKNDNLKRRRCCLVIKIEL